MARKAWLEISSFWRVNGRENKLYWVMESWFTLLLISLNRVKHYIYSSKDIRTEGDNFAFLDSCSVFNAICFRIVIFPTMCCLDEVCLDDFTTKIFKCFLKCCVKNKARRRHFSFLLRWIVGFELNLAQFIYVEVEISTAAYQTFSAIVILHIIFLLIIGISFFRSHKILTLGYVFVFKGLSLSMAVLVFNMTTAGFNVTFPRSLRLCNRERNSSCRQRSYCIIWHLCRRTGFACKSYLHFVAVLQDFKVIRRHFVFIAWEGLLLFWISRRTRGGHSGTFKLHLKYL